MGLQKAIAEAGNDRAALVRNLKNYLLQFPDAPRKAAVHRALVRLGITRKKSRDGRPSRTARG